MLLSFAGMVVIAQQTSSSITSNPADWFQYGLAGALIILMGLLLKYITQRDRIDKEREEKLALQRSEMYREDNRKRDERWFSALEGMTKTLKNIDLSGDKFINATNTTIEKFVQLVNKVMEQSNYQTQVLTELKGIVSQLPAEFQAQKKDIIEHLEKLGLNYEIKKKDEE